MPSILILSQYYPPETGAPQNRLSSLARHLKDLGWDVSVLTAMPNYPGTQIYPGYTNRWYMKEQVEDITVHRSWIFVSSKKSVLWRLFNYFSFVFSSLWVGLFKVSRHDVLICESPPLFLGITALLLRRFKKSKLVFNVSDLWPETAEQLGIITNRHLLNLSTKLEEAIYKKASLISGQTQGIVNNISSRFPGKEVFWLRNGVDVEKFDTVKSSWRSENGFDENDFIVMYGGILGYAQNLEVLMKAAKMLKEEGTVKFIVVGDGPNKDNLLEWQGKLRLENVTFFPRQPSAVMPFIIQACDVGLVPLRDIQLFRGAIPSKIFEYLILRKPVLLGVDGEAKELFINEGNCGLFYTPQSEQELTEAILKLKNNRELAMQLGNNGERYVKAKFDRKKIASEFHYQLTGLPA